jgi:2-polyprenyl-3-methyl-5-hydroxy-6-metoxy-1,4-benzoquinol methylase
MSARTKKKRLGNNLKLLDCVLQRLRIRRVRRHIRSGDIVLDFGCNDGRLFQQLGHLMAGGIGIDHEPCSGDIWKGMEENFQFQLGGLELLTRENLPQVNLVTALAVVEHLQEGQISEFARRLAELIEPNGRILLTIPHPMVDHIVHLGMALKLLSGVSIDDHHGLNPHTAKDLIEKEGWHLEHWTRFQIGLNNEMLFFRTSSLHV